MRSLRYIMGAAARRRASAPPPGSIEWITEGSVYAQISAQTTHDIPVPAGAQVGDMLLLTVWNFGTVSSVVTDTAQSLTQLVTGGGEVGAIYGVVISGSVPTEITVTLSAANDYTAQPFVARGVTQSAGTVTDGNAGSARTTMSYNSDVAESLVLGIYTTTGSLSRAIDTATFSGLTFSLEKWSFTNYGTFAGVHDGSTGANTFGVTWNEADDAGGRWISVALKP